MPKYTHPETEGFGARLARLRKAAGFTQTQLAEELGMPSPGWRSRSRGLSSGAVCR